MTYIRRELIEEFDDNTNRHELGIGLMGKCLALKRKDKIDADVQHQLDVIGAKIYRQVLLLDILCRSSTIGCCGFLKIYAALLLVIYCM